MTESEHKIINKKKTVESKRGSGGWIERQTGSRGEGHGVEEFFFETVGKMRGFRGSC